MSRFEPDLVVVSSGFDAYRDDALAGMDLTPAGFRALGHGKLILLLTVVQLRLGKRWVHYG